MRKIFLLLSIFLSAGAFAQKLTPEQYVAMYRDVAIAEMKRVGIPASITLAQGILETESGNSDLVKRSNNHFGIKCKSTWTGESVKHTDDAPDECFRKYAKAEDSYRDHSDYLRQTPRYAFLFELQPDDYKGWCYGLKKAGYATNPRYPQILMTNIEKYNLLQYDAYDASMLPATTASVELTDKAEQTIAATAPVKRAGADVMLADKKLFNSLKALYAKKGTSLLAIAEKAELPLQRLLEYNDLRTDGLLKEEQWIYLEKKRSEGKTDFYTALQNESLYDVAQIHGIQLRTLMELNRLGEDARISKGQKIRLRSAAGASVSRR